MATTRDLVDGLIGRFDRFKSSWNRQPAANDTQYEGVDYAYSILSQYVDETDFRPVDFRSTGNQQEEVGTSGRDGKEVLDIRQCPPPRTEPLVPGRYMPDVSEESLILRREDFKALAAAVPLRFRGRPWTLLYSSARDGISLQTLYRRGFKQSPTFLVIRDLRGHVFGCYAADAWRIAPRYYGSGETFVFQLRPGRALYRWWQDRMPYERNDYFQFCLPECLAVGGGGAYALYLKEDLLSGSSGECSTFGSPCIAGSPDFEVGKVELWSLAA